MAIKVASFRDWNIAGIVDGLAQPDIKVVLYFFSPAFEQFEPQKALTAAFPGARCIGASMVGGWSSGGAIENGITAMSLSAEEVGGVYVSLREGVKEDPVAAAKSAIADLKQQAAGKNINPDEYLGLIFFDGLCLGELIMKEFSLEPDLNMAFVGGAAADEMAFAKTFVGVGDRLSCDGLAVAILKMNIPFFVNHYVHYIPTDTTFTISKVETTKRIAWEIDGEPAAAFYAKLIGLDSVDKLDSAAFSKNPVGLKFGDSIYARSPKAVVDGKGLQFYCYIEAGNKVCLLEQGDIIANAIGSLEDSAHFLPGIQGSLLFNCVLRYLELQELDKVNEFNNLFGDSPMAGFNTYGEELFTHHNQTLTAVFFGTRIKEGAADPYKAKRLFHYTDSKLKSLIFDIISRNEILNITISQLKMNMNVDSMPTDSELAKLQSEGLKPIEKIIDNYRGAMDGLGAMVEQSNVSKREIEKMLVVYHKNVEETGTYVFSIVDEIRAQNSRLVELREQAETASRTKSSFLASMSHEIRTPMNAITGMAELLLRGNLPDEARGYAQDIKHAAANLLSIVNDLLDFSKIEAGKLEIIPSKYLLASLINDVVSIIRMRLVEKPIRFYTNIDGFIPNCLIGDEVRLRQIFLNLLNNAVKYTDKGHIGVSVTQERREGRMVWLKITVSDTGHGIRPEDQQKLFREFVQVDTRRNRTIEGTGLGLPIVKRLCTAMDGSITVKSEYGKGSSFTALIPQGIDSPECFAAVEDAEKKKVLIYERRTTYTKSVCWSMENMKVPYTLVHSLSAFTEALFREEWAFVFSGYGLYSKIKPILAKPSEEFPGGKRPGVALMVEWGFEASIPNVRFLSVPVQSLSIANALNDRADQREYFESAGVIQYEYPQAKLLIVDDISTNLKVAEGLLAPYNAKVDICLSGQEAVELVKQKDYDIVFMDHMMPEMDGIEATTIIRAWENEPGEGGQIRRPVSIVALTANAVFGMREMFMEKGFSDFLAKPIDVFKLDEMLERWIPEGKKERRKGEGVHIGGGSDTALPLIPGIDAEDGVAKTGGTLAGYRQVLSIFRTDAKDRLSLLQNVPTAEELPVFITQVHALKSASASLGAHAISEEAAKLEAAGMTGDLEFIEKHLSSFAAHLARLVESISIALDASAPVHDAEAKTAPDMSEHLPLLLELVVALNSNSASEIDRLLDELDQKPLDAETREKLEKVSDDVLVAEFENAAKAIEELAARIARGQPS